MKKILFLPLISLLAASCNLIGTIGPLGIMKTIDGGSNWQQSSRIANSDKSIAGVSITEMVFDPDNRERIFAGTINNGLWQSDDSAVNWSQVLSAITVYDILVDRSNAQNIYVAGIFSGHGKIIKTTDRGKTWTEIYNEASVATAVNTLTQNPLAPNELYAGLSSGVLIKSIDSGNTWYVISEYKEPVFRLRFNQNGTALYLLLRFKGVYKSTDNGQTWADLTKSITYTPFYSTASISHIGVDSFVKMALDDQSPGVIYVTTSKGLYRTTDDGKSWQYLNLPVRSSAALPRAIASTKGGMVAYTSIANTIFKTLDSGNSWQTQTLKAKADVNKILIDPAFNQISYAGLVKQ